MNNIINSVIDKELLILGFGREGQSTYRYIRKHYPEKKLTVADLNEKVATYNLLTNDKNVEFITGIDYLEHLNDFEKIIKSPGIPLNKGKQEVNPELITSQADLFISAFHSQIIGITGTKGKSTTSSLIYHILRQSEINAVLVGNIGIPPFEVVDEVKPDTKVVYELSAHQLEYIRKAPHISILLNIFEEHLDFYNSFEEYSKAKYNCGLKQTENDYFIYCQSNKTIQYLLKNYPLKGKLIPYQLNESDSGAFIRDNRIILKQNNQQIIICDDVAHRKIIGDHNLLNILAASVSSFLAGATSQCVSKGVTSFTGLEHRIEFVGEYKGILFYNDSIATIPEATMEAINTLKKVDTIILGGYDRGIDYSELSLFVANSGIKNIILLGKAGERIACLIKEIIKPFQVLYFPKRFDEIKSIIFNETQKGRICLLSPSASSYDEFKNFEERGNRFKELIQEI